MASTGVWPLSALQRRWRQWWQARLQPSAHCTLRQRNLYIVPTRAGLVFGLTLLLLLVASINFQLNLGYALTFLLAGSAIVSMHMTHATLRGLALHLGPLGPVFAGQPVSLEVRLDNPGRTRHGLALAVQADEGEPQPVWFDADAQAQTRITLHWMAPGRGHWPAPLLRIETRFPFGLFRAWGLWRPRLPDLSRHHPAWGAVAGGTAGLMTAMTAVSVMPLVPYLQSLKLDKDALVQALGLGFTVAMIALALRLQAGGGLNLWSATTAIALVAAFAGMWLGTLARGRLSAPAFQRGLFIVFIGLGLANLTK